MKDKSFIFYLSSIIYSEFFINYETALSYNKPRFFKLA